MVDHVFAPAVFTPAVTYRDPKAATEWLGEAFGFTLTMAIEGPAGQAAASHFEMAAPSGGRIMIGGQWAEWTRSPDEIGGVTTQSVHVHLADGVDEHCEHARRSGARIVAEPADQFFGDRTYRAVDLEGHVWTFATTVRAVSRADAEAIIGIPIFATDWD
ncbi:VOC family protein [Gordonia sp. (in: high G+C Gram-positive bacteria)]|mgnify:CR=1 FL=1|uniref:VOC family protein n=1 Tax=Gordonia sp. (in: high G+C Gram-positive bacteria) TaxID=84139 RepID=UPI0016A86A86|nr:VOC family protein [Gordonia sp. (in: high G+C Gram-positive bacteria)]NLG48421.1 glyoxalase [Gordonia sp. (in: high G+C Gram-positive bacteria)]